MKHLFASLIAFSSLTCCAQGLSSQIISPWHISVFVSTNMPKDQLVNLARQAKTTKAAMLLSGFPSSQPTISGAKAFISEINVTCCSGNGPAWYIDPAPFKQFNITAIPSFVLSKGRAASTNSFSKVSGDMDIGNALKFFAQESKLDPVRVAARELYSTSFGGYR